MYVSRLDRTNRSVQRNRVAAVLIRGCKRVNEGSRVEWGWPRLTRTELMFVFTVGFLFTFSPLLHHYFRRDFRGPEALHLATFVRQPNSQVWKLVRWPPLSCHTNISPNVAKQKKINDAKTSTLQRIALIILKAHCRTNYAINVVTFDSWTISYEWKVNPACDITVNIYAIIRVFCVQCVRASEARPNDERYAETHILLV